MIPYKLTVHKKLFDLTQKFFDLGSYENEELVSLKSEVDTFIASLTKRNLSSPLKTGLTEDLSALSTAIDLYLKDDAEQQS